jgi:hypothetical protein
MFGNLSDRKSSIERTSSSLLNYFCANLILKKTCHHVNLSSNSPSKGVLFDLAQIFLHGLDPVLERKIPARNFIPIRGLIEKQNVHPGVDISQRVALQTYACIGRCFEINASGWRNFSEQKLHNFVHLSFEIKKNSISNLKLFKYFQNYLAS